MELLFTFVALLVALFAIAPKADADDSLDLINRTEAIGPGITYQHIKDLGSRGWDDRRILTIDMSNGAVSTNLLSPGSIAEGQALSQMAGDAGAVAGVNSDFFDIGNSYAPHGAEIKSGKVLKSPNIWGLGPGTHIGVGNDGIGRLLNLAIDSTATFGGTTHTVNSLNASNHEGTPGDTLAAFTPAWGDYSRLRGFEGAGNVAEVLVVDGKVDSVEANGARAGQIPADGFALVGRDSAAEAIRALQPGDPVSLSYEASEALSREMKWASGIGGPIITDGHAWDGLQTSVAPRTAAGFKDGGHTLVLATWDGPGGTGVGGVGVDTVARDLVAIGVETGVELDGGGSTEMVARALGDKEATVRSIPSDGHERTDGNGIGVFVAPGNGQVEHLIVNPAAGEYGPYESVRVFPGLHRSLDVHAVDDHETPVALTAGEVSWSADSGTVEDGVLAAPQDATGKIAVEATDGSAQADLDVRVLGPIHRVGLSSERLSIPEPGTDQATNVTVTGYDAEGYAAPLELRDLDLDYDHSVVEITAEDGELKVTPLTNGATVLTVSVNGKSVKLPITVGVKTLTPYSFAEDGEMTSHWRSRSTGDDVQLSSDPEGLKVTFGAMRNVGITPTAAAYRVKVPGQPLRLRLKIKSSISVPNGLTYLGFWDSAEEAYGIYGSGLQADPEHWQYVTWTVPSGVAYPIEISSFQGINTSVAQQSAGTFIIGQYEAEIPSEIELPAEPPLEEDPLISADGTLPEDSGDFNFATLSDVQFTADNPGLTKVATTAINRIRQTDPDLIVLNGDITDRGLPQDMTLAREVLENAGCELIPAGSEPPADSTPDPSTGKVPCYYVPGNHESYGVNNVQSTLANFEAEFGKPYRTFDHKGTRFILLASALGTLRGTSWEQMVMFKEALAAAVADPAVDNVMVFAHHPVDDPASTRSSQLGDREEVALIEKMLADFRQQSGKPAAMVGSHAQIEHVERIEGVPYVVLTSSGKDPYGTPDRGGFTGWSSWSVDPQDGPSQQWLTADVHAFAQSISLNTPATVKVGATGQLSGSIVQPEGVSEGERVVPLRYPMSVDWGGSADLAIGSGEAAIDAAREAGKVAILDPRTRILTGLRAGSVQVSVTNDSMRPYTDEASLAPITTEKTIVISTAPVNTAAPTLGGEAKVAAQLSCGEGEWSGTPAPTLTYGWLRDGSSITGASGSTYTVRVPDAGHEVGCVVTATNDAGEASAASSTLTIGAAPQGCLGDSVTAAGSSLQAPAHRNLWSPAFAAHCPGGPTVDYQGGGSGPGLAAWGFGGGPFDSSKAFIGTEEAPTAAQIKAAAAASGSGVLVVPVAQTAIGIVVNPPSGCQIESITNKQLESVMRGNIRIWNKLQTASGAGCVNAPITRVVRAEGAGTTNQLKGYLARISGAALACTEGSRNWAQLAPTEADEKPNTVWPENGVAGCSDKQLSPLVTAAGGTGLVDEVNATEGAIGYAALPDIEATKTGDTGWVQLQNNGVSNKLAIARMVGPVGSGSTSECGSTPYGVPSGARSTKPNPTNIDWSQVTGVNPNIAGATGDASAYPLCTLTYAIALTEYSKAGFTAGQEGTVAAYLAGVVTAPEGQEALATGNGFYTPLPHTTSPSSDVLGAARLAASKIGF